MKDHIHFESQLRAQRYLNKKKQNDNVLISVFILCFGILLSLLIFNF